MAFNGSMTQEPSASKKPASASGPQDSGRTPSASPGQDQTKNKDRDKGKGSGAAQKGQAQRGQAQRDQADKDPLRRSRAGGFYVGVIALGIVLVLLIIFIVQNTGPTTVRFLAFEGETPVAVALLIAAAAGLFLAGIAASLRIFQLRRRVKSVRKS